MDNYGWWSLVPPLMAIALAFLTREVLISLTAGIISGGVIYALGTGGTVLDAPSVILQTMTAHLSSNVSMIIFLMTLGALVAVIASGGGALAYGDWAHRRLRSQRSASLLTMLLGIIIFIDDYFNCLMVGTVMRPVTDKFKISREKLAYLIDATSAPVCILAPISSWAAYVISCIPKAGGEHGMELFLHSMPWNFYAIGTLLLVVAVCCWGRLDFGPMRDAERVTRAGHDVGADRHAEVGMAAVPVVGTGSVWDLVLPIVVLIVLSVVAMLSGGGYFAGTATMGHAFASADAGMSLALASFGALLFAFVLFVPRRLIRLSDFSKVCLVGMKTMVPAVVMLTLAWTISGVCDELLHTGAFISQSLQTAKFPLWCLPALFFVISAFLAFATGASWGAIGILVPIAVKAGMLSSDPCALPLVLGATLAGAVQGDHCSPISDTTILSSTGAGCRHHNHVVTQMPYALAVGTLCLVAYLAAGAWVM